MLNRRAKSAEPDSSNQQEQQVEENSNSSQNEATESSLHSKSVEDLVGKSIVTEAEHTTTTTNDEPTKNLSQSADNISTTNNNADDKAAIKIQATYRGFRTRKQLKQQKVSHTI